MTQAPVPPNDDQLVPQDTKGEAIPDIALRPGGDRRKKRRALISCPLRVRSLNSASKTVDEISTSIDVSRNGVLFATANQNFHRSMEVAVTLPYATSTIVRQSEQIGSIVRVSALPNGAITVAVAFGLGGLPRRAASSSFKKSVLESLDETKSSLPLILLVEGDVSARDSLKAYLSTHGYRVVAVGDATEGRDALNAVTPALVIAEIEGEGLPGFDLCVHVKATPRLKHIPVMLTTKSAYPTDYSNAHSLGAVVCMAKPYRQDRIGHVVRLLVPPCQPATERRSPK